MNEDSAHRVFYKPDSFHWGALSVLDRLVSYPLSGEWMSEEGPDQSALPEWMREPVWIIEITVRKA